MCLARSSASRTAVSRAALAIWWPLMGARTAWTRAAVTAGAAVSIGTRYSAITARAPDRNSGS
jgi:hypothetical protein